MTATSRTSQHSSKRMTWGILIILILVAAYTAGWFYLASVAKERFQNELAKSDNNLACQNLQAHGYPFSLYMSCAGVQYTNAYQAIDFKANALDVGASLFSPFTARTQLSGPANIKMPETQPVRANWDKLIASARIAKKRPQDISLSAENLHMQLANQTGEQPAPAISFLGLQFDLNSLDKPLHIKMTFDDLRLSGHKSLSALPELDGAIDISSPSGLTAFSEGDENGNTLRGKSLQLNQMLFLLPSGTSISMSGPASVDEQGLVNADMKIRLTNPAAIGKILQDAFPALTKNINTIIFALNSMPKDETGATIVPVIVKEGKVIVGFIPLGHLPAL